MEVVASKRNATCEERRNQRGIGIFGVAWRRISNQPALIAAASIGAA